ncbi:MAG: AraC family transcriptional regulator [Pseudomonadota bacterium]
MASLTDGGAGSPLASLRAVRLSSRTQLSDMTARVSQILGAPPGVYRHSTHDGLAIYMALSRKVGSIDVGEGVLEMKTQAGEFIVGVPKSAAQIHSFRGGRWIEVVLADPFLSSLAETGRRHPWRSRWVHRSFHKKREIGELLMQIVRGGLSPRPPEPLRLDALACALSDALTRFLDAEFDRRREVDPLSKRAVDEIIDYMDAHLGEPITLRDLAGFAGLRPTRFAKAFRNAAGESPYQALMRRRLEAARFALMTGRASISEIAFAHGFSSQQHLTALFSGRFGIAPGAFRQQIRAH